MIIKEKINKQELQPPFVKAVADINRELISIDCELHIDCMDQLIKDGSNTKDLWGFNIYPDGCLDYISLINIRPQDNNRSMEIQSSEIRQRIDEIVKKFL